MPSCNKKRPVGSFTGKPFFAPFSPQLGFFAPFLDFPKCALFPRIMRIFNVNILRFVPIFYMTIVRILLPLPKRRATHLGGSSFCVEKDSNHVRTCRRHVHEPVQTLANSFILFSCPPQGKTKCRRIHLSLSNNTCKSRGCGAEAPASSVTGSAGASASRCQK